MSVVVILPAAGLGTRMGRSAPEKAGISRQDVFINIVEVAKENWSFGNGEMQYAP